jgi:hypothetical protein
MPIIDQFHSALASVSLLPTESGGLLSAFPDGTRSLLLIFPECNGKQGVTLGAAIYLIGGGSLRPGDRSIRVRLEFWADEAANIATPNVDFKIWYSGRAVGEGRILTSA